MLNRQLLLKSFAIVLLLLAIPLANLQAEDICFEETTAKLMVVELERSKNLKDQILLYEQTNIELSAQIEKLKEINILTQDQLEIYKKSVELYQNSLKSQEVLCNQAIENAKPSLKDRLTTHTMAFGGGAIITLLLLLLL